MDLTTVTEDLTTENLVNQTETVTDTTAQNDYSTQYSVPVFWVEDYRFWLIHIMAASSLSTSILVSATVLCYLSIPCRRSLWSRPIWERLVIYLAVCDLLYSISHLVDHVYMMAELKHLPGLACTVTAFVVNEFALAQTVVVAFTAINAFTRLVNQTKVDLGPRDWKLVTGALGMPALLGTVGVATGNYGPSGIWCYVDIRKEAVAVFYNVGSMSLILGFMVMLACYTAAWFHIRQAGKKTALAMKNTAFAAAKGPAAGASNKYDNSSRVMMVFVGAYISQWWPAVICCGWKLSEQPPTLVYGAVVFFCNMGGVINFFAYTLIRRKITRKVAPA